MGINIYASTTMITNWGSSEGSIKKYLMVRIPSSQNLVDPLPHGKDTGRAKYRLDKYETTVQYIKNMDAAVLDCLGGGGPFLLRFTGPANPPPRGGPGPVLQKQIIVLYCILVTTQ